jgi:putative integral membrane protein (TIGR02587 family)
MADGRPVDESLREYGRGLAGGLLFSLPLLYTMEVWWAGFTAQPLRLIIYLAAIFVILLGYNNYSGIRHDSDWTDVVVDSVEELGLGIVTAAAMLFLLGQITVEMNAPEIMGKTVVEAGIVAIGFSVGTAQFGDDTDAGRGSKHVPTIMSQVTIALCGAVLFAANVAPTEEIQVIAMDIGTVRLLLLMVFSAALGALILYFTNFTKSRRFSLAETKWEAFMGAIVSYAVALVASAAALWFFEAFDGVGPAVAFAQIVVLALPSAIGASAGRLLLQS